MLIGISSNIKKHYAHYCDFGRLLLDKISESEKL